MWSHKSLRFLPRALPTALPAALTAFVLLNSATAEPPSLNDVPELTKWCAPDGRVQYATWNVRPEGFAKCADQVAPAWCDPEGRKFYGPKELAPRGYLDCAIGPRIQITPRAVGANAADVRESEADLPQNNGKWSGKPLGAIGNSGVVAASKQKLPGSAPNGNAQPELGNINAESIQAEMQRLLQGANGAGGALGPAQGAINGYQEYLRQLDTLLPPE